MYCTSHYRQLSIKHYDTVGKIFTKAYPDIQDVHSDVFPGPFLRRHAVAYLIHATKQASIMFILLYTCMIYGYYGTLHVLRTIACIYLFYKLYCYSRATFSRYVDNSVTHKMQNGRISRNVMYHTLLKYLIIYVTRISTFPA